MLKRKVPQLKTFRLWFCR